MPISLVLAGTDPPSDFTKPVHILLKEAVATQWNNYSPVLSTVPTTVYEIPASSVGFSNTWFSGYRDVELIFLHSVEDRNVFRRSTDWAYMPMATFVDIHIFVRGSSMDTEPTLLHTVRSILDKLVELNQTTLIPHTTVTLQSSDYIPEKDNQQDVYHWLYSCAVRYTKVKATTV